MTIDQQNKFIRLKSDLLIFIGYPNSLMLSAQPDESSSIRRACSLSDLSMGKGKQANLNQLHANRNRQKCVNKHA